MSVFEEEALCTCTLCSEPWVCVLYLCLVRLYRIFLSLLTMFFFFFNDTATTEIYTLSLHDALPISRHAGRHGAALARRGSPLRSPAGGRRACRRGVAPGSALARVAAPRRGPLGPVRARQPRRRLHRRIDPLLLVLPPLRPRRRGARAGVLRCEVPQRGVLLRRGCAGAAARTRPHHGVHASPDERHPAGAADRKSVV